MRVRIFSLSRSLKGHLGDEGMTIERADPAQNRNSHNDEILRTVIIWYCYCTCEITVLTLGQSKAYQTHDSVIACTIYDVPIGSL